MRNNAVLENARSVIAQVKQREVFAAQEQARMSQEVVTLSGREKQLTELIEDLRGDISRLEDECAQSKVESQCAIEEMQANKNSEISALHQEVAETKASLREATARHIHVKSELHHLQTKVMDVQAELEQSQCENDRLISTNRRLENTVFDLGEQHRAALEEQHSTLSEEFAATRSVLENDISSMEAEMAQREEEHKAFTGRLKKEIQRLLEVQEAQKADMRRITSENTELSAVAQKLTFALRELLEGEFSSLDAPSDSEAFVSSGVSVDA